MAVTAFARLAKREQIRWYLFGAQAVAAYGVPRTTNDIDITIDLGDRALGSLVPALKRAGFVARIADERFAQETRIYPVTHTPSGWPIDLVLAGPGIEDVFFEHVRMQVVEGQQIPVIAPEHLIATKLLAQRPKDLEDVRSIIRISDVDHDAVERMLEMLERALDQSDLRPLYARLCAEVKRR